MCEWSNSKSAIGKPLSDCFCPLDSLQKKKDSENNMAAKKLPKPLCQVRIDKDEEEVW